MRDKSAQTPLFPHLSDQMSEVKIKACPALNTVAIISSCETNRTEIEP